MSLNIKSGTVGYNNKILVSDSRFSLGKNDMINSLESENPFLSKAALTKEKSDKNLLQKQAITHKDLTTIDHHDMHEEEIAGDLTKWFMLR